MAENLGIGLRCIKFLLVAFNLLFVVGAVLFVLPSPVTRSLLVARCTLEPNGHAFKLPHCVIGRIQRDYSGLHKPQFDRGLGWGLGSDDDFTRG